MNIAPTAPRIVQPTPTAPAWNPASATGIPPTGTPSVVKADPARGPLPKSYTYELALDPTTRSLSGRGSIAIQNTSTEPLTELVLRLWGNTPSLARAGGSTTLEKVTVDGAAATANVNQTVATIPLSKPLNPGESATLSFDTTVTVPNKMGRTGMGREGTLFFGNALPVLAVKDNEGWNTDPYVVMGESFYNLASDWNVTIVAPEDRQLITTGTVDHEVFAGNKRAVGFKAPHVRDFIVVAANGYKEVSQDVDGTKVRAWAPEGEGATAAAMLKTATASLKFYNDRYGKYNLPEYDVVATKNLGGGMEYPGLTLNDTGFQGKEIVAHETGHQWFYSMTGNNEFDDPWLDESFTSFITSEFMRQSVEKTAKNLRPAFDARAAAAGIAPDRGVAGSDVHVSSPMNVLSGHNYFGVIYSDGARVLADLKKEIGEDVFVKGMRAHVAAKENGIATTREFIDTMSSAAGRDLTSWFQTHNVYASEPAADTKLDPNGTL